MSFVLSDKHIALLRHAYVEWGDVETGAPQIDGKRPYGNSDVAGDVIKLLFGELPDGAGEALRDYALQLHRETETALQIVLATGKFDPGEYVLESGYDSRRWVRKGTQ